MSTISPAAPPRSPLPDRRPAARPVRRRGRLLLLLLLLAGAAAAAYAGRRYFTPAATVTDITFAVRRGELPITITERGDIESAKTVDVRCEVEGRQNKIIEIVAEGTRVTKDQVVVRFDAEELTRQFAEQEIKWKTADGKAQAAKEELEVQKNKSASEIAKAELALTLADLDRDKYLEGEYKAELEDRQSAINLAARELQEAQEKLENFRVFVKKGFGTPEQLRLKELEVARAQNNLDRDKAKLMVLQRFTRKRQEAELTEKAAEAKRELSRQKSSTRAAIAKAQADYDTALVSARLEKTSLDRIQKQLDRCIVKAPEDGILVYSKDRYWDPSSRIQAGAMLHFQQTIFSLPDLAQMQVKVKVHEAMVKKISKGLPAEIRIEAYADRVLHGTIEKIGTLAHSEGYWDERGVKEYLTVVKITDLPPEAGLKPGFTAQVKILAKSLPDVLQVPVQAVAEKQGKHVCYIATPGGVERRDVVVGENNEKFVEVKEGLEEGEPVLLDARARLLAEGKDAEQPKK